MWLEERRRAVRGGSASEPLRRRENPHRKRAVERMNNALHFLRTLAEFREPYLLLKRCGIPLVPLDASILERLAILVEVLVLLLV